MGICLYNPYRSVCQKLVRMPYFLYGTMLFYRNLHSCGLSTCLTYCMIRCFPFGFHRYLDPKHLLNFNSTMHSFKQKYPFPCGAQSHVGRHGLVLTHVCRNQPGESNITVAYLHKNMLSILCQVVGIIVLMIVVWLIALPFYGFLNLIYFRF